MEVDTFFFFFGFGLKPNQWLDIDVLLKCIGQPLHQEFPVFGVVLIQHGHRRHR